jgi:hypothetical protein
MYFPPFGGIKGDYAWESVSSFSVATKKLMVLFSFDRY